MCKPCRCSLSNLACAHTMPLHHSTTAAPPQLALAPAADLERVDLRAQLPALHCSLPKQRQVTANRRRAGDRRNARVGNPCLQAATKLQRQACTDVAQEQLDTGMPGQGACSKDTQTAAPRQHCIRHERLCHTASQTQGNSTPGDAAQGPAGLLTAAGAATLPSACSSRSTMSLQSCGVWLPASAAKAVSACGV
jgi:hypothetical protein